MLAAGADLVDVGGESTRPGADRVDARGGARAGRCRSSRSSPPPACVVSVDTMRAEVAAAALDAGAALVNDVSGGLADPTWLALVADARRARRRHALARATAPRCSSRAVYGDVVAEVCAELPAARRRRPRGGRRARAAGRSTPASGSPRRAGTTGRCWPASTALLGLGRPVLVGASRKTFLGRLGVPDGATRARRADRDAATAVTSVVCAGAGAWGVRVHDVAGPRGTRSRCSQEVAAHR